MTQVTVKIEAGPEYRFASMESAMMCVEMSWRPRHGVYLPGSRDSEMEAFASSPWVFAAVETALLMLIR